MAWFRRSAPVEKRQGGDFYSAVLATIEAQAATKSAAGGATAAVEAAAGLLARSLSEAAVRGPTWAQQAVSPLVLAQIGRDLIRSGESLHRIDTSGGRVRLWPVAQWHWHEGRSADPDTWRVRATEYGPSGSETRLLPYGGVVWIVWGISAATPWTGRGPLDWASLSAKTAAEAERSLGDEASGPIANLLPVPDSGEGADSEGDAASDPNAQLRADIAAARGKARLVETTAAGWGEGKAAAPQADWKAQRLGPNPPASMTETARDAFSRTLSACGVPPPLFTDSDGTSQREALRRFHMATVLPVAGWIEHELTAKLDTPITLDFDTYPLDIAGRAASFRQLVTGGMEVEQALAVTGLLSAEP